MTETTPLYLEPPRIAICGGSSIDATTAAFCEALGAALAKRDDAVLITGGCKRRVGNKNCSVDWHTVRGARSILDAAAVNRRIETILPGDDPLIIEKFEEGRTITIPGASPQARRFRLLASADVAVAIAGGEGTRQHIDLALAIQRPLLPVPFFNGESAACWNGPDQPSVKQSMALSDEDVAFLNSRETRKDAPSVQAAAERVCEILWRRLTKICMVIMPFAKEFDPLYEVLEPAIQRAGLKPLRTDKVDRPIDIMDTVNKGIANCRCAIAVIDGLRPNVFYELGQAHAYEKPVVILVSDGTKPPFDIAGLAYIEYKTADQTLSARVQEQLTSIAGAPPARRLTFSE